MTFYFLFYIFLLHQTSVDLFMKYLACLIKKTCFFSVIPSCLFVPVLPYCFLPGPSSLPNHLFSLFLSPLRLLSFFVSSSQIEAFSAYLSIHRHVSEKAFDAVEKKTQFDFVKFKSVYAAPLKRQPDDSKMLDTFVHIDLMESTGGRLPDMQGCRRKNYLFDC